MSLRSHIAGSVMRLWLLSCVVVCGVLLGSSVGCSTKSSDNATADKTEAVLQAQRRTSKNNSLFRSVVSQLNRLPESSQLALTPPTVLLDSRSSTDGQEILATLTRIPSVTEGPFNFLRVPAGNCQFKEMEIAPGDTLKYFIDLDDDTKARIKESGSQDDIYSMYSMKAKDLVVAQVIDNNALIIQGGLSGSIATPAKIEVWRNVDDLMKEIDARLGRYAKRREPPLTWQPTPDGKVIEQLSERLNQWLRQRLATAPKPIALAPTELIAALPEALRGDEKMEALLTKKEFTSGRFRDYETRLLQGATWARDISRWAGGDYASAAEQATALFDWTVRNIRLVDDEAALPRFNWEIMLHGQGDVSQRASVFAALCQQQSLPAVVIEVPIQGAEEEAAAEAGEEDQPPYLLVGVALQGEIVLFDPLLGLPIPGEKEGTIATLAELQQADALLRALDLPGSAYPLSSELMQQAQVRVVATPFSLTDRAKRLDQQLGGEDHLALAFDHETMAKVLPEDQSLSLWDYPYEVLLGKFTANQIQRNQEVKAFLLYAWRPRLWKARTLHFRGIVKEVAGDEGEIHNDFQAAQKLYMNPRIRPNEKQLAKEVNSPFKRQIYSRTKAAATYSLGLIAYDQGRIKNAAQWLDNKTLASEWGAPYADGVRYSRARVLEEQGDLQQAAELLEADQSPQQHGNRLRAKWLRAKAETDTETDTEAEADDVSEAADSE